MTETYGAVVCGAGIAGISAAYHLCVTQGLGKVLLVDERPPLSLTSDKSTECYRNWWPGPGDGREPGRAGGGGGRAGRGGGALPPRPAGRPALPPRSHQRVSGPTNRGRRDDRSRAEPPAFSLP